MSKSGRSFSSKKRNRQNRKEKPMIIITAEGRNETEPGQRSDHQGLRDPKDTGTANKRKKGEEYVKH